MLLASREDKMQHTVNELDCLPETLRVVQGLLKSLSSVFAGVYNNPLQLAVTAISSATAEAAKIY